MTKQSYPFSWAAGSQVRGKASPPRTTRGTSTSTTATRTGTTRTTTVGCAPCASVSVSAVSLRDLYTAWREARREHRRGVVRGSSPRARPQTRLQGRRRALSLPLSIPSHVRDVVAVERREPRVGRELHGPQRHADLLQDLCEVDAEPLSHGWRKDGFGGEEPCGVRQHLGSTCRRST